MMSGTDTMAMIRQNITYCTRKKENRTKNTVMDNSCLLTRMQGTLLCIWSFAMRVTFHSKRPVSFRFLILCTLPFTSFPLLPRLHMPRHSSYSYSQPQRDVFENLPVHRFCLLHIRAISASHSCCEGLLVFGVADTLLGARRIVETRSMFLK